MEYCSAMKGNKELLNTLRELSWIDKSRPKKHIISLVSYAQNRQLHRDARDVTESYNICLTYTQHYVQSPIPEKEGRGREKTEKERKEGEM